MGKPRTTGLRPWLWGTALTGSPEHSSTRLRTERSVVRGKGLMTHQAKNLLGACLKGEKPAWDQTNGQKREGDLSAFAEDHGCKPVEAS